MKKILLSVTTALVAFCCAFVFSGCHYDDILMNCVIIPVVFEDTYKEPIESIKNYNEENKTNYLCYSGETKNALHITVSETSRRFVGLYEEFTFQNINCSWYVIRSMFGDSGFDVDITHEWEKQDSFQMRFANEGECTIAYYTDKEGNCVYGFTKTEPYKNVEITYDYYLMTDTTDRAVPLAALSYIL